MSLMPCPICGHQCSDLARQCPNCGHPHPGLRAKRALTEPEAKKAKRRKRILKWSLLSALVVVVILGLTADYYRAHPLCPLHKVRVVEVDSTRIGHEEIVTFECPGPPEHRWTVVRKD